MPGFDYVAPGTLDDAVAVLADHGDEAIVLAGGQSLLILLRQRLVRPAVLVGLRGIDDLRRIEIADGRLVLGAMVSYAVCSTDQTVEAHADILRRAASSVGSVHIRNRGTVGGCVAHADPAGDVPTVLLALGADLVVTSADSADGELHSGSRTERRHRIEDFFTGFFETRLNQGELLVRIEVDAQPVSATHGYRRFSFREGEYPMCVAAVRLEWADGVCTGARVALGGAADRPCRLPAAEAVLTSSALRPDDLRRLLAGIREEVNPPPDVRGTSAWKSRVVEKLLVAAVRDAVRGHEDGSANVPAPDALEEGAGG